MIGSAWEIDNGVFRRARELTIRCFEMFWTVFGVREIDRGVVILVGRVRWGWPKCMTCRYSKSACHKLPAPW